ncbi:MAG: hypothetical protein QOG23_861 [Blastocatellia bacterium]|nr:hypothetical protein [Blastocatellia bacterium]
MGNESRVSEHQLRVSSSMRITLKSIPITTLVLLFTALIGVAQKPELVLQTGHSKAGNSIAVSPDGKTLASGSQDNTIKLWDMATGSELRTLTGHSGWVLSVAFGPDGKVLASGGYDHTVRLWDVSTGRQLRTFERQAEIYSVAFSPDGKILASGSYDRTVRLWDLSTGSESRTLKGHSDLVNSVGFSPDGKLLASGSADKTIKLWDVSTGIELRTLKGHAGAVSSIAFSTDGKVLASGSSDHTIKLWDVSNGSELRTLKGHSHNVASVAFSPDGKTLASGSEDQTVKLCEVATGTELRTLKGHSDIVASVAFSPDGKILASGSWDQTVRLWDVQTGAELRALKRHSFLVNSVVFSPDGKILASGSSDRAIKLWDVATGAELRTLKGPLTEVSSIAYSPDGKTLASGGRNNTVTVWDVATGVEMLSLKVQSDFEYIHSISISPDGKTLASGSSDSNIKFWDLSSGRELRTLKGHSAAIFSVAFSPDGRTLASGSADNTIRLWNVATGTELRVLEGLGSSVAFSPDSKTLASASSDHQVKLWGVATGKELGTLTGHSDLITSVCFSRDGRTLASSSADDTVKLWDVATGTELRTLRGHAHDVLSLAFSLNDKYLVSGSADATTKVWEVDSGQELASLVVIDEGDWLVVTPDGLFDGSPAAWNKIIWRFNNNTFNYAPVEAFFSEFFYPGLLIDVFAGKHPKAPSDISQKDRRQPELKLRMADATSTAVLPGRNLTVQILVAELAADKNKMRGSGAKDVRLFRNGSLVRVWHGDVLKGKQTAIIEAAIPVVAGENRLTAYAFNHDNIKSTDATLTISGAESLKREGVGYVLAVGVNQYANTQYNLKYAVADAHEFAEELEVQQGKLNNYERVEVISLKDKDATKANILKSLADLSAKVQPEDALVIFFAGHGTAQQNRFYLIPHDLGYAGDRTALDGAGLQNILAHSISDEEISRAVEGIDAGQMLLVIDACNSGQALEAEEKRRGPMNSKGLAQLAYEKGMYILTAAQSYQAASEAERYGHGFLTYALVEEGLKTGAADKEPKDGQVLLREWLDFATERVPQMQQDKLDEQKKQGRQLDRIKFAEADSGTERSIQRPRVFYRRETETHPLVVARP